MGINLLTEGEEGRTGTAREKTTPASDREKKVDERRRS